MPPSLRFSELRRSPALRRIAAITAVCGALGLAYAYLSPKWYRSLLTVVPAKPQRGGGGLTSLLSGELGGLASGLDSALGGAEVPRIAAVLQSIAVTDAVIEKFDLRTRYDEEYQENARDALWRRCKVKTLTKPGLVQLTCEDKDPRFVQAMLAFFAEYGNQVFRRVGVSSATEEVRFLEKRVSELRAQSADTAQRMREFQETHQIVDLDSQAKAVVSAMAGLNAQRISKELALDYARTFSSGDEATLQQLRAELSVMETKLRDLESAPEAPPPAARARKTPPPGEGVFPAALSIPKLRAEYEGLYRDRRVAETTLVFALERLETAKASEARDVSTFLVLDPPTLPTRHWWPKRLLTLAASILLGLALGAGLEWVRAAGGFSAVFARTLRPAAGGAPARRDV